MADERTRAEREQDWWAKWRRGDYTWAGLQGRAWQGWIVTDEGFVVEAQTSRRYGTAKPLVAAEHQVEARGRDANLQDYWRADPATGRLRSDEDMRDELIGADGQPVYHRAHLPLSYENGTPTAKAGWNSNALDDVVDARLLAAEDTEWDGPAHRRRVDFDSRAQFQGGVWLKGAFEPAADARPLSVRYANAAFAGDECRFNTAVFSGDGHFQGVGFFVFAWFDRTTFAGQTSFTEAVFFGGASFTGTKFSGEANFANTSFTSAWFDSISFSDNALFTNATFSNGGYFERTKFLGEARFQGTTFSGNARFNDAVFSGDARFPNATFSGSAMFDDAIFSGKALFVGAAFAGYSGFKHCQFKQNADFTGAGRAAHVAAAEQVVLLKPPTVENARAGTLKKPAGLEPIARGGFQKCSFAKAVFFGNADFSNRTFTAEAEFDSADFRGAPVFHDAVIGQGVRFYRARFDAPWRAADTWSSEQIAAAKLRNAAAATEAKAQGRSVPKLTIPKRQELLDARFAALEQAYRTLKLAMENIRDRDREQTFYRYELVCRRRQSTTFWGERLISQGYGLISNYGGSLFRPVVTLTLLTATFGLVYWGWASAFQGKPLALLGAGGLQNDVWDALLFSANNVFRPFNAWSADSGEHSAWLTRFLSAQTANPDVVHGAGWRLGIRLVATAQSLVAIVLAFLFALGVRRRFQIS